MMVERCLLLAVSTTVLASAQQPVEAGESLSLRERALLADLEEHIGNPCKRRPDGERCYDDIVIMCSGGQVASNETCSWFEECKEGRLGFGSASCEEDACEDKADGFHCKDDRVVQCLGLKTVNFTECPFYQECERDRLQLNMASCVEDVCERKADGMYCEDDHVVQCQGLRTVNVTKCGLTEECQKHARGRNMAACVEDDCRFKPDGLYCKHDGVVNCSGQVSVGFSKCPFYQECEQHWQAGSHFAACQEDACEDKADGWHCKG
eukprot:CAMPEP_0176202548 /NCGR_PEP_ID=MMETSP0121_2-20121125/10127_1 /TAXON_ID=160619 /ORGANISM="Kryptoperidinium foliaceum, Strain CCMP 1326" /LENGTH=264 /DNA_ID=CAMNT_0017541437 /DNA_START=80 /DNA_END=870 /DNA_ORIENTATION=-